MKRILFIDDNIDEWIMLRTELKNYDIEVHWQLSLHTSMDILIHDSSFFDLIVIDFLGTTLPSFDVKSLLQDIEDKSKIVITSQLNLADFDKNLKIPFIQKPYLVQYIQEKLN